jgi:hypothetical protein
LSSPRYVDLREGVDRGDRRAGTPFAFIDAESLACKVIHLDAESSDAMGNVGMKVQEKESE